MAPRRTPLFERHLAAGGKIVDFAGWEMPQQYTNVRNEHNAVRTAAGLFDVSHMGRVEFTGQATPDFLQGLVSNDLSRLQPMRAQYNLLCREDGGIIDDLVVYRRDGEPGWSAVINASNREKDMTWMRDHAPPGVELIDRSDDLSLIALQGPKAAAILPATGVDLDAIPYFGSARGEVAGVPSLISRTGYTGEDGFELFVPSEAVAGVWDAILEAGATPCGLAARDVCRLEAGLRLYGNDMDDDTNPYEAGLGWTVKLQKGEFTGREALQRLKAEGPHRVIAGLEGAEKTIPRHGAAVSDGQRRVGTVTSGTYSFWLNRGIGMAMVEAEAATVGTRLDVEVRGGPGAARVSELPFYRGSVNPAAARA